MRDPNIGFLCHPKPFESLRNCCMSSIEAFCDLSRCQVLIYFDWGQIWLSSVVNGRPKRAALAMFISLERKRANQHWQVSALMAESPYTLHISRCASVAFNSFRKKNNKMCRKCTFLSSIFNEYCAHKTHRNWINSSARCQAFSNLSNSMRQFAVRATHAILFSEQTSSSEKTAELNEQLNIYEHILYKYICLYYYMKNFLLCNAPFFK